LHWAAPAHVPPPKPGWAPSASARPLPLLS